MPIHSDTSKQHRGCRVQDPGTRGKHHTGKKNPWCTRRGCGVQNSGPWDPWLPAVESSRLFAQRAHSARCAPYETANGVLVELCGLPNTDCHALIRQKMGTNMQPESQSKDLGVGSLPYPKGLNGTVPMHSTIPLQSMQVPVTTSKTKVGKFSRPSNAAPKAPKEP